MRIAVAIIAFFYAACAVGSLWLLHVSEHALMGFTPDPLASVFALLLALPWSLLLYWLPSSSPSWVMIGLLGMAMALNLALFLSLTRRWRSED